MAASDKLRFVRIKLLRQLFLRGTVTLSGSSASSRSISVKYGPKSMFGNECVPLPLSSIPLMIKQTKRFKYLNLKLSNYKLIRILSIGMIFLN